MRISQMLPSLEIEPMEPTVSWFPGVKWAIIFAFGFGLGFSLGNGHTTQDAVAHVADQYGQAVAVAGCEHFRAKAATKVAKQAIHAAIDLTAPIPSSTAIPADNCPHPTVEVK